MNALLVLTAVLSLVIPARYAKGSESPGGESSPYVVGEWFLNDTFEDGTTPVNIADTQFTFLNPTKSALVLEYAFFDTKGGFCGCDRDNLSANGVTRYTMSAEASGGMFECSGNPLPLKTTGTLKAIVFKTQGKDKDITLKDALQVGFQIHFLTGGQVTEAGLKGITITKDTKTEIEQIHQQCVDFCTSSGLCPPLP